MRNCFLRNMKAHLKTREHNELLSNRLVVVRLVGYKKALDYDDDFKSVLEAYGVDVEEEYIREVWAHIGDHLFSPYKSTFAFLERFTHPEAKAHANEIQLKAHL